MHWKPEIRNNRPEYHELEGLFVWGNTPEEAKANVLKIDSKAVFHETPEELEKYEQMRKEIYDYYKKKFGK